MVTLFWVVLGTAGCLPFIFSSSVELSITDAVFESISGLTTTGATVISGLDALPKSILFYRQLLQWLGGMGIIVLAVALLPMLGIGGMQLYRAESPGPVKDNKLVPRLAETAKSLWLLYLSLTIACMLAYWAAGMSLFDAISHSFSTVAIGGFSTHDASIAYFDSPLVEAIAVLFMIVAGINFALHFFALQKKQLKHYLKDPSLNFMPSYWQCFTDYCCGACRRRNLWLPLRSHAARRISGGVLRTTTGYATADFNSWPLFLPYVLLYAAIIGACAGSTGGGMKVIRILLIFKQGFREVQRLIHPRAIIPIKLGKKVMPIASLSRCGVSLPFMSWPSW